MAHEQFADAKAFANYLMEMGWISPGGVSSIESACTAFQMFQRKAGIETAQKAMNKACEKAR